MKTLALLLYCVLAAQANVLKSETMRLWEDFKAEHNKVYQNEVESDFRFKIFKENVQKINEHNSRFEAGKTTYEMGINKYSDMLFSEISETMLTRTKPVKKSGKVAKLPKVDLPETVDWRTEGAVTPVKDQRNCPGTWAFVATGALEGQHFLSTGYLVSLSEQNLIDCSKDYANNGCASGSDLLAYQYIADNGGIDTEEYYPYQGRDNKICMYNPNYIGATDTGYLHVTHYDEEELKKAVATIGPIGVGIDAQSGFMNYKSGVMVDEYCSSEWLNHSVLVVGYGTEDGQDYWLVKNSWGASYGDNGYIKMARNHNNMCGIATDATYPTV